MGCGCHNSDPAGNPSFALNFGALQQALACPPEGVGPVRLVVGFSGGMDSSVLLHLLAAMPHWRRQGLRAVHVHHGWSAQADDWVAHCQVVAAALAVPLQVLRVRMAHDDGHGPEARARRARYTALAAALADDELLVCAQHADDQAETVLLKLLRGSGLDGLGAMRELARVHGVRVWRPLLNVSRRELADYAEVHRLHWQEDPSNADPALARGWLRSQVLPLLHSRFPQLARTLGHTALHLQADARVLEQVTATALARCRLLDPRALHIQALLQQPADLRVRVLLQWLQGLNLPAPPVQLLQDMLKQLPLLAADREPSWRWGGQLLQRYRQVLYAVQHAPLPVDWQLDFDGSALCLPFGLGRVGFTRLRGSWRLRGRRGGERIRLRGIRRPLKKLLQELAIPPWERSRLVLLHELDAAGGEQLRAVLGLVLDDELRERLQTQGRLLWFPNGAD